MSKLLLDCLRAMSAELKAQCQFDRAQVIDETAAEMERLKQNDELQMQRAIKAEARIAALEAENAELKAVWADTRDAALEEAAVAVQKSGAWCGGHGNPPDPSTSASAKLIRSMKTK